MSLLNVEVLFQPFRIKTLQLENRVVMAPMTRAFAPHGIPDENIAAYYRRRAEGKVGLILSEGTVIERPASRNEPGIPFFHGAAALAGWQRVDRRESTPPMARWARSSGTSARPKGTAAGGLDAPVESPSGLFAPGQPRGEAMSEAAIVDTIAAFGRAAADAKRLGFDVVELHGAHGYLIDQFFWAGTNSREDRFGGATLKERVTVRRGGHQERAARRRA